MAACLLYLLTQRSGHVVRQRDFGPLSSRRETVEAPLKLNHFALHVRVFGLLVL
jgi:hypothetical protein